VCAQQIVHESEVMVTFMRRLDECLTDRASNSYLKARPVEQRRVDSWIENLTSAGWMGSQALCAKEKTGAHGSMELWIFVRTHTQNPCTHTHIQKPRTSTRTVQQCTHRRGTTAYTR
jgi:hypothetical protein